MFIASILSLSLGFLFRLCVTNNSWFIEYLNENEISSPMTSWKRINEGLWLKRHGISPYSGDTFHQTPLFLELADFLDTRYSQILPGIFCVIDFFTAVIIGMAAREAGFFMVLLQHKVKSRFHSKLNEEILLTEETFSRAFLYSSMVYLFNPYSAASCAALSTTVFDNLLLALTIYCSCKGYRTFSMVFLALLTYQGFYPIIYLVPISMMLVQKEILGVVRYNNRYALRSFLCTAVGYLAFLSGLHYSTFCITGSWEYLNSSYSFIMTVPELVPNAGVFWYFVTELFAHFENFFLIVFQLHMFVYPFPLAIKFRNDPITILYVLLMIVTIFKSYPTVGEIGAYLSLFPVWYCKLYHYYGSLFLSFNTFIWCGVLSPIFYHLWIYSGSANANFYFALTLVSALSQIFLMTGVLHKTSRREYDLYNESTVNTNGDEGADPFKDTEDLILE